MIELEKEAELTKKEDKENIQKIKDQLSDEKKQFSMQLASLKEQLNKVKADSEQELQIVKNEAADKKEKLEKQVSSLQAELFLAVDRIERARKSVFEVKKASDGKVEKMKKDSDRFKDKMRKFSQEEKNELKRRLWDLEYKVSKAKYILILAQKEAKALKTAALDHEAQIEALEEDHNEEILLLKEKMKSDEKLYSIAKIKDRKRTQRIVSSFRNKLGRKEKNVVNSLEFLRQRLLNDFELENEKGSYKKETFGEQTAELSRIIAITVEKMDARSKKFDDKVTMLEKSLIDARETAKRDLKEKEKEYEMNLEKEREQAQVERNQLIREKNDEIKRAEEEGNRNVNIVRIDLTQKLNVSRNEVEKLKDSLEEKNELIGKYEEEKKSYRKLAKLVWKATREKLSSRRKRLKM